MQDKIGDYTFAELRELSADDLAAAQAREFAKPQPTARPLAAGVSVGSSVPVSVEHPQAAGNVWARKHVGEDFITPSGQKCRLQPLSVEALLLEGILDQVTRLDGLAQQLVTAAQGLPPAQAEAAMPSREDLGTLLDLVNRVTLMAVVEPKIWADDAEVPEGTEVVIRISDIDLGDRMAILEESLKGLKQLDRFRNAR